MKREIIDIDAPIDLTQEICIDLTILSDDESPPPQKSARIKRPKKMRRVGTSPAHTFMSKSPSIRTQPGFSQVIELDSEGEGGKHTVSDQGILFLSGTTGYSRKQDEDDAFDMIHAGYDLGDSGIWKPVPVNESRMSFLALDPPKAFDIATSAVFHRPAPDMSHAWSIQTLNTRAAGWASFNSHSFAPRRPLPLQSLSPAKSAVHDVPPRQFYLVTSFKSATGSINRIVQYKNWVAICTAAIGGQPDEPDETVNHYNREGAVMVWNDKLDILPAHVRPRNGHVKQYGVNDIKFDPFGERLVTTGNDKSLQTWECNFAEDTFTKSLSWRFDSVPHDVVFKPQAATLAVAERRLFVYSSISDGTEFSISVAPARKKHSVGAMAWGHNETATYLYVSSEPDDDADFVGYHKAVDTGAAKVAYDLKAEGAGDAIAVSEDGTKLALLTRRENRSHPFCIYDVRRHDPQPVLTTSLTPFPASIIGEVNNVTFSPDGIYVAVGRNDNHAHVYDSRFLNRLLFDYEHVGPSRTSPGNNSFGVQHLEWTDGCLRNLPRGIVTCGSDGCIRFWDPFTSAQSPRNGTILAECTSDIAYFLLGDHFNGERALVVGGCAGEVSIFDLHPSAVP